jgi:magnesium-transporting ATPase (P-type)
VLWINMTTAVALGLMLAFEPMEAGIMSRPPRDPAQPLLTAGLVERILLVSALLMAGAYLVFHWQQAGGASPAEARTAAINVFVVGQTFYLFNCRSLDRSMFRIGVFSNRWLTGGVLTMAGLQALLTYAPFMQDLFHTAAIDAEAWIGITAVGLGVYGAVGAEKWLRRRISVHVMEPRRPPPRRTAPRAAGRATPTTPAGGAHGGPPSRRGPGSR